MAHYRKKEYCFISVDEFENGNKKKTLHFNKMSSYDILSCGKGRFLSTLFIVVLGVILMCAHFSKIFVQIYHKTVDF